MRLSINAILIVASYLTAASSAHAQHGSVLDRIGNSVKDGEKSGALRARSKPVAAKSQIPEGRARAIALAHIPGQVREVELEQSDGMLVYSIEVVGKDSKTVETQVNAATGEYLGLEVDSESGEQGVDD
jgi:uncharacterized membrane protein YkoI